MYFLADPLMQIREFKAGHCGHLGYCTRAEEEGPLAV